MTITNNGLPKADVYKRQDENTTQVRSCAWSAPGCHPVGCGLLRTSENGKLVKVEGDPEHPISQGRLCARCLDLMEFVYSDKRIIYPMKRAREDRGKDTWERITWDQACLLYTSFQQPNPFPMSVYDNVAFGPRTHGIKKRADLDEIVERSLRDAAIWDLSLIHILILCLQPAVQQLTLSAQLTKEIPVQSNSCA